MKQLFWVSLLLVTILFMSCTKEKTNFVSSSNGQGKVLLKVDKENAPSSVVLITATLSREGFQSITSSLDIKSDSSAEIKLNDIREGDWNLMVEAKDSLDKVLFRGETIVTIISDFVTQVNLTLIPTSSGFGSVYISVTWGQTVFISPWSDYTQNPIFTTQQSPLLPNDVAIPKIVLENGGLKMYYQNVFAKAKAYIGYAESVDGYKWYTPYPYSVSPNDSIGNYWDSYTRGIGPVYKSDNQYLLYYYGFANVSNYWQIGLAISSDGIHFTKLQNPVLNATGTERLVVAGDVIKVNKTLYMFYTYGNPNIASYIEGISVATSLDGINWTRTSKNPILFPTKSWEGTGVGHPSVIYDGNEFRMIYMNALGTGFGIATSKDGINWVKNQNNPVFTSKDTYQKWTSAVYYPFLRKVNNNYMLYYTGVDMYGKLCIGVATKNVW